MNKILRVDDSPIKPSTSLFCDGQIWVPIEDLIILNGAVDFYKEKLKKQVNRNSALEKHIASLELFHGNK